MAETANPTALLCTHCGAVAGKNPVVSENNTFCCQGCLSVYQILNSNGLCDYYNISEKPGVSRAAGNNSRWTLEELNLMEQNFVLFADAERTTILFHIPSMHCSSCIWLLEKINNLDKGIVGSRTDFVNKQLKITYNPGLTGFGKIVLLLSSLGYEPSLMPESNQDGEKRESREILIKLGVAGFCAGNIMMFSFPQYLGLEPGTHDEFGRLFDAANAVLSLPLIFYAASSYFKAFRQWVTMGSMSVKVPLALGIGALWLRSIYEVVNASGPGYFDSLAGLIFFLLIGTWLQNRTFDRLRFGEKARYFFPLVARVKKDSTIKPVKVVDLKTGDRLVVRQNEIIPVDSILLHSDAWIDYAYATGESTPVHKVAGEVLFGGGKNKGDTIELEAIREFDQGKLTEIWKSAESESKTTAKTLSFEAKISRIFIWTTIALAVSAWLFWISQDASKAWFALVAVLMVACPCALALAPPFAYNIVSNVLAKAGLFVRKPEVVGILGDANALVFDKTGTLTDDAAAKVNIPESLNTEMLDLLYSLTSQSNHPYSRIIANSLENRKAVAIADFKEFTGKGATALAGDKTLRIGSYAWVCGKQATDSTTDKKVYFSINNIVTEPITVSSELREGVVDAVSELSAAEFNLVLCSGDTEVERVNIEKRFPGLFSSALFNQTPADKVSVVKMLQKNGTVLMVGDGLNDAGALNAGDAGLVITKDTNNFTPEASAILLADSLKKLPVMLKLAQKANRIVQETFVVSLIYNIIALALASTGRMNPLIAAILMPASSIALMTYAWARTKLLTQKRRYAL
jgi:Cu+-exporting ATPase